MSEVPLYIILSPSSGASFEAPFRFTTSDRPRQVLGPYGRAYEPTGT
jgi:hypothetical protein